MISKGISRPNQQKLKPKRYVEEKSEQIHVMPVLYLFANDFRALFPYLTLLGIRQNCSNSFLSHSV